MHSLKFYIVLPFVALVLVGNLSAKPINYQPKMLQKELNKSWNLSIDSLNEIEYLSDRLICDGKFYKATSKGYVFIGRINSCRAGGCTPNRENATNATSEYFDAYIIYNSEMIVQSVRVFNYQATHGHEITSKGWLKQFIGYSGESRYEVGKEIDSISGATISVHAITNEVNYITEILQSQ